MLHGTAQNGSTRSAKLACGDDDGQITARQFLQGSQTVLPVIDRFDPLHIQQFRQLVGIDAITLAAKGFEPALKTYSKGAPFYNVWVLAGAFPISRTYRELCPPP